MQIKETFEKLTNIQKVLVTLILVIMFYGLSASVSFAIFSKVFRMGGELVSSLPGPATTVDEEENEPKTEKCPLDGSMHTKKAKLSWEKRRPLAVMVENHSEAKPQSGLSSANVVYEAVAEGGITRFAAIFYCNLSDIQVGPVRSARTYFLDWISEYDPLYAHVGGANTPGPADALSQIIKFKIKSLNQFGIGFPTYWRDYQRLGHPVATEHTMYSTTQKLWEVGAKRGWEAEDDGVSWSKDFTPWKFKEDQGGGSTTNIKVNFWASQESYFVEWNYDAIANTYNRKNGGVDHTDLNNKKQLSPKNIVVQFERESNANDGYEGNVHLLYGTLGKGKVLVFQDGKVSEGTWNKALRTSRTKYLNKDNKEVEFNKGQIWIQTVPEGAKVEY